MSVSIIPRAVVQVIAAMSGAITTVSIPIILSKINQDSEIDNVLSNMEGFDSISGVITATRSNAVMLSEHEDRIEVLENDVYLLKSAHIDEIDFENM